MLDMQNNKMLHTNLKLV